MARDKDQTSLDQSILAWRQWRDAELAHYEVNGIELDVPARVIVLASGGTEKSNGRYALTDGFTVIVRIKDFVPINRRLPTTEELLGSLSISVRAMRPNDTKELLFRRVVPDISDAELNTWLTARLDTPTFLGKASLWNWYGASSDAGRWLINCSWFASGCTGRNIFYDRLLIQISFNEAAMPQLESALRDTALLIDSFRTNLQ